ncbi:MAG: prolyl oligopeptidase family serine peptidase [Sporolactobacillus sp.]
MRKIKGRIVILIPIITVMLTGCSFFGTATSQPNEYNTASTKVKTMTDFQMDNGNEVYVYGKKEVLGGTKKVPLVLFMCGTTGDPQEQAKSSGWVDKAQSEDIIVISPKYNDYATYGEVGYIISVVQRAIKLYPIDTTRIYSLGFSNGGATSVALTSEHPEMFAGIAAYGWMVDLRNQNNKYRQYGMPFQVIQGTNEFIENNEDGNPVVMRDEQEAIRSLLLYNDRITQDVQPDYSKTPYWGYHPDEITKEIVGGKVWTVNNYYKENYDKPFSQFILVEDAAHIPHMQDADYSWEFLKHFSRSATGKIMED